MRARDLGSPFSAVRFIWATIAKYGHNSRILPGMKREILCSLDCLAESVGFEPSVQVLARTTV